MKRVIRFQRTRYYFFAFSICLALAGIAGYLLRGGLNLGVDFRAGVAMQFQIAPPSFSVQYTGPGTASIDIPSGEQALTAAGDLIVTVTAADGSRTSVPFRWNDYATIGQFTEALQGKVPGLTVQLKGDPNISPKDLLPLVRPADISAAPFTLNLQPQSAGGTPVTIAEVRSVLAPLGSFDLQEVGTPASQQFIARVEAASEDSSFQTATQQKLTDLLGTSYGADHIVLQSSDFVGPKMARSLGVQAVWLVIIALVLIQVYMAFRFKPIYAVSAVLALVHDAMVMLTFAVIFRVQIDAATIAAILTILGYSINDTIVIFDRVRENQNLMRESGLEAILDASVTQTLGRTVITSGATMMAVVSLFLLTSGSMKNFALLMIVGIIEGTYSTVFIASPIVLEWENLMARRRRRREMQKYGVQQLERRVAAVAEEEVEAEEEEPEAIAVDAVMSSPPSTPVPSLEGSPAAAAESPGPVAGPVVDGGAPGHDGQPVADAAKPRVPQPLAAKPVAPQPGAPFGGERRRRHKRRRHH